MISSCLSEAVPGFIFFFGWTTASICFFGGTGKAFCRGMGVLGGSRLAFATAPVSGPPELSLAAGSKGHSKLDPAVFALPSRLTSRTSIHLWIGNCGFGEYQSRQARAECRKSANAKLDHVFLPKATGLRSLHGAEEMSSGSDLERSISQSARASAIELIGNSCGALRFFLTRQKPVSVFRFPPFRQALRLGDLGRRHFGSDDFPVLSCR